MDLYKSHLRLKTTFGTVFILKIAVLNKIQFFGNVCKNSCAGIFGSLHTPRKIVSVLKIHSEFEKLVFTKVVALKKS